MKRRSFSLGIAGLGALWALGAKAEIPGVEGNTKTEVTPYTTLLTPLAEEAGTVRLYFSYSCPFCRAHHRALSRWGSTLPKQIDYREGPVVGMSAASVGAGFGYYAMKAIAAEKLADFNDHLYAAVQDRHRSLDDIEVFAEAATRVGVPTRRLAQEWRSDRTDKLVTAAAKLAGRYQVRATPTIAVAGRMLITPEVTGGINDAFFRLANAVVSKALIEVWGHG